MRSRCAHFLFISLFVFITSCVSAYQPLHADGSYRSTHATTPAAVRPLIILDAGHGGTDEGAKVNAFKEKRLTLLTTLLAKKHLEEMGYRVVLTRSRDTFISLARRVSIANNVRATLFVSIHYNSSPSVEAKGIEIFYYNSGEAGRKRASQRLANCILYRLLDQTAALSRGIKSGNFHVIRETDMPAVLIEAGFMTNKDERQKLRSRDYLDRVALGIAQGIDKYIQT